MKIKFREMVKLSLYTKIGPIICPLSTLQTKSDHDKHFLF